jgi:hypothetical protein
MRRCGVGRGTQGDQYDKNQNRSDHIICSIQSVRLIRCARPAAAPTCAASRSFKSTELGAPPPPCPAADQSHDPSKSAGRSVTVTCSTFDGRQGCTPALNP